MKETDVIVTLQHFTRNVGSFGHSMCNSPEEYNVELTHNEKFIIQEETLEYVLSHGAMNNKELTLAVWADKNTPERLGIPGILSISYSSLIYQRNCNDAHLLVKLDSKYKRLLTDFKIAVSIRRLDNLIISLKHSDILVDDRGCWSIAIIAVPYYDIPKMLLSLFLD